MLVPRHHFTLFDLATYFPTFFGPLLGFDFGSTGMLWFLAAAGAPILIHLWNRRERKVVVWAAMEYLLAAIEKKSRRILVENWLLLAVRTLLVILLALAVSKPFFDSLGTARTATARGLKVLVIDSSYSMGVRSTEGERFELAKQKAADIVNQSPQGDGFVLLLLADPPLVVIGHPVFDRSNVLVEIERLRLSHAGANLPATLHKVQDVLTSARNEFPELETAEVVLITDLGRTSWGMTFPAEQAEAEFRQSVRGLASQAGLAVVDVASSNQENVAATDLRMAGSYATVSEDVLLEATIRNFGRQDLAGMRIEWLVDGRGVGEGTVDVEAGAQANTALRYRFESPGLHSVEVRSGSDVLELDNRRCLVIPVKDEVRVLCIDGRPSADPFSSGSDYLRAALEAGSERRRGTAGEAIQVEVGSPAALTDRDLSRYDAVFLSNVGQFSRAEARVMRDYVLGGGGLVFFLGDRVQPENYNQRLGGQDAQDPSILPVRLTTEKAFDPTQQPLVLDPHGYRHPLLKVFRDNEQVGFLRTPIYRYWGLELPEPSSAQTALSLTNGDPLIVTGKLGAGVSIVVTTPAEVAAADPWNLMPALQNFVPLVRELLKAAMLGQFQHRNLEVGQMLSGSAPRQAINDKVTIQTPVGERAFATIKQLGDRAQWGFGPAEQSGIYRAQTPGLAAEELFAVNLDARESDLTRVEPQELLAGHFSGVPLRISADWRAESRTPTETLVSTPRYIHGWLLAAALGLLFADSFLSWFLGSRQT